MAVCLFLIAVASLVAEHRLYGAGASVAVARGLSSCGLAAHGMWDPPGPGIKPMTLALAGGLLTTDPPVEFPVHVYSKGRAGVMLSGPSAKSLPLLIHLLNATWPHGSVL